MLESLDAISNVRPQKSFETPVVVEHLKEMSDEVKCVFCYCERGTSDRIQTLPFHNPMTNIKKKTAISSFSSSDKTKKLQTAGFSLNFT